MIIAVAVNPGVSFGGAQHTGDAVVAFFRAAGARVKVVPGAIRVLALP